MNISQSTIKQFRALKRDPHLRMGQALYNFLKLEKVKNPENVTWANKLYNASDDEAAKMIEAATDHQH